jgi:co-chaperonin GroES (HSP10)
MGLEVVGHRVLIKPDALETKTESGIIINYGDMEKRHAEATTKGVVVQVGPLAWKDAAFRPDLPEWKPWCKPGDEVIYAKFSGKFVKDPETEEELYLTNDIDVQVVVKRSQ